MNARAHASPSPRSRGEAAAFPPLVFPADTPSYARAFLASLDEAVTRAAKTMADAGAAEEHAARAADLAADTRLIIAARLHAHAGGATAFFLFHYLRLFEEQAEARRDGKPCPLQTWTMPDWSPASVAVRVRPPHSPVCEGLSSARPAAFSDGTVRPAAPRTITAMSEPGNTIPSGAL